MGCLCPHIGGLGFVIMQTNMAWVWQHRTGVLCEIREGGDEYGLKPTIALGEGEMLNNANSPHALPFLF